MGGKIGFPEPRQIAWPC